MEVNMADGKKAITAQIPVALAEQVDEMADRLDRSRGWIVRQALAAWVDSEQDRYRLTLEALADVLPCRPRLVVQSSVSAVLAVL